MRDSWFETRKGALFTLNTRRIPKGGQMMVGSPRHQRLPTNPAQALMR
jgi:hypothetical protein